MNWPLAGSSPIWHVIQNLPDYLLLNLQEQNWHFWLSKRYVISRRGPPIQTNSQEYLRQLEQTVILQIGVRFGFKFKFWNSYDIADCWLGLGTSGWKSFYVKSCMK